MTNSEYSLLWESVGTRDFDSTFDRAWDGKSSKSRKPLTPDSLVEAFPEIAPTDLFGNRITPARNLSLVQESADGTTKISKKSLLDGLVEAHVNDRKDLNIWSYGRD